MRARRDREKHFHFFKSKKGRFATRSIRQNYEDDTKKYENIKILREQDANIVQE